MTDMKERLSNKFLGTLELLDVCPNCELTDLENKGVHRTFQECISCLCYWRIE